MTEDLEEFLKIRGGAGKDGSIGGFRFGHRAEHALSGKSGAVAEELEEIEVPATGALAGALSEFKNLGAERSEQR
jgi:hypothetical protein